MTSTIGIISGSGPEAGLDLAAKVLLARRTVLGEAYRGDTDAPRMVLISEPRLGLSMELAQHRAEVWSCLEQAARQLTAQVGAYAIACNTLNVFSDQLDRLELDATLVSVADVTRELAAERGITRIGLLGAAPVVELGQLSAYRELADEIELVTPGDPEPLHRLIHDIKLAGGTSPQLGRRLTAILGELEVEPVLLACTELPLVELEPGGPETIDVTMLLAEALERLAR